MPSDPPATDTLEQLTRVMGLAIVCPFSQDNPEHCQLCEVRKRPMALRVDWVRGLSADELRQISSDHADCLRSLERPATAGGRKPR